MLNNVFPKLFYIQYDTISHGAKRASFPILIYLPTTCNDVTTTYIYTYKKFSFASKSLVPLGNESKTRGGKIKYGCIEKIPRNKNSF